MSIFLGKKIKLSLKLQGKKQKDLVSYLGANQATVSKWLTENIELNRDMPYDMLKKTATFLGVSVDFLLGINNKTIERFIPLIGKANSGTVPNKYSLDRYEAIPIDDRLHQEGMYAIEAEDNSMSPKINNGDLVYCCSSDNIQELDRKIVHYYLDGKSGIRKLEMNETGTIISLIPINSDFDAIMKDHYENKELRLAKVIGVVDTDF